MHEKIHKRKFSEDIGNAQLAEIPASLKRILQRYIEALEKGKFHIKLAFLFGSFAKGNQHE